jgi:hypothetical protein
MQPIKRAERSWHRPKDRTIDSTLSPRKRLLGHAFPLARPATGRDHRHRQNDDRGAGNQPPLPSRSTSGAAVRRKTPAPVRFPALARRPDGIRRRVGARHCPQLEIHDPPGRGSRSSRRIFRSSGPGDARQDWREPIRLCTSVRRFHDPGASLGARQSSPRHLGASPAGRNEPRSQTLARHGETSVMKDAFRRWSASVGNAKTGSQAEVVIVEMTADPLEFSNMTAYETDRTCRPPSRLPASPLRRPLRPSLVRLFGNLGHRFRLVRFF